MALLFIGAPQVAGEGVLVLEDLVLDRHVQEGEATVEISLLLFGQAAFGGLLLQVTLVRVLRVLELRKVPAAILKLNVGALLDRVVEIGFNLGATPLADVAREQVARQVPQRDEVARTEGLLHPVSLLVRELVKHRAQVGNLVVRLVVARSSVDVALAFFVGAGEG